MVTGASCGRASDLPAACSALRARPLGGRRRRGHRGARVASLSLPFPHVWVQTGPAGALEGLRVLFWPSRQPRLRSPEPGAQWALRAHLALKANPPLFRGPGPQRRAPSAERPRFASLSAPRGRAPVFPLCRTRTASSLFLREDCRLPGARAGPRCWAVPDRGHVLLTGAGGSLLGGPGARSATHGARPAPLRAGQASACPMPPSVASLGDRQQGGLPACEALPGLGAQPSGAVWARFGEGLAEASPQGQPSWGGGSPGTLSCPGGWPAAARAPAHPAHGPLSLLHSRVPRRPLR